MVATTVFSAIGSQLGDLARPLPFFSFPPLTVFARRNGCAGVSLTPSPYTLSLARIGRTAPSPLPLSSRVAEKD